jgi:hypothetical protein
MSGFDELGKLELDLARAPAESIPLIKTAIGVSAKKGKKAWQEAAGEHRYAGGYPATIDYDPVDKNLSTDLGPNLNRGPRGKKGGSRAGLGIVEDGVNSAPQRNYLKAEEVIEEDLPHGVEIAIDQTLKGLGL